MSKFDKRKFRLGKFDPLGALPLCFVMIMISVVYAARPL